MSVIYLHSVKCQTSSISNNSVLHKHIVQFNLIHRQDANQVQTLQARVNLGAMAKKGYSAFPRAPVLLEPHHQIIQYHIQEIQCGWGVLPLCREAVSVFCKPQSIGPRERRDTPHSPSQLGQNREIKLFWLVGFYGISTFVGYLTLNPFL